MDFHLKTMNDLMNGVNKLSNGDFKHRIDVRTGDELGKLANSFNIMTREIFKQNEELTKANDELVQTSFTLWGEMAIAKKIQTILLPKKPSISGYEISVYMNPADEVGGDYFDIINIDDKVNWITIGDVSGHGVPAGLIMMMVQSCIRSNINLQPQIAPSDLLNVVNKTISHNIIMMKENKFMTLTTIRLSRDGSAVFSGRHEDIIIYHAKDGIVTTIKTDGICISPFSLGNDNVNKNFKLESGDVLLLYTDGIIEAHKKNVENPDDYYQNTLGISGLCDIIKKYYNQTPEEIKDCILKEMEHFEIKDDISMVIVKKI